MTNKIQCSNTFIGFLVVDKIEKIIIMVPTTYTHSVIANKMWFDLTI